MQYRMHPNNTFISGILFCAYKSICQAQVVEPKLEKHKQMKVEIKMHKE